MNPITGKPVIIGHRGSSAHYPENTMLAFQRGIEQNAEMFEFDVRLTKDGVPVCMHDDKLLRLTGKTGTVSTRTWKFLQTLDIGAWKGQEFAGQRICTLDEAFAYMAPRIRLNLEIKFRRTDPMPLVKEVARVMREQNLCKKVLVSSFRHDALPLLQKELPEVVLGRLYNEKQPNFAKGALKWLETQPLFDDLELPFRGRILCLHYTLVTPQIVKDVDSLGGGICVWTVNEPDDMLRMADYGVAGIIANDPQLLRETLEKHGRR